MSLFRRCSLALAVSAVLVACGSTGSSHTTSQTSAKSAKTNAPQQVAKTPAAPRRDVSKLIELYLPEGVGGLAVKRLQGRNLVDYDTVMQDGKVYVEPGQYRIRFTLDQSTGDFSRDVDIAASDKIQYIHAEVTPDMKRVYTWISPASPEQPAFFDERTMMLCELPDEASTDQNPIFSKLALESCKTMADKENPRALLMMGYFYQYGVNLPVDKTKALNYYTKAIELDVQGAEPYLFDYFSQRNDTKRLVTMLEQLAKEGSPRAAAVLAHYYMQGEEVKQDIHMARDLSEQAIDAGLHANSLLLAHYFASSARNKEDYITAKAYTELYRVATDEPDSMLFMLESNLKTFIKPTDRAAIDATKQKVLQHGNKDSYGTLCVQDVEKTSEMKNKNLTLFINSSDQGLPIVPGKPLLVKNLPLLNRGYQLYFRTGTDTVYVQQLNYNETDGKDMCLIYNKEIDALNLQVNAGKTKCGCPLN